MSAHGFENRPMLVVIMNSRKERTGQYLENYCKCSYRVHGTTTKEVNEKARDHLHDIAKLSATL